MTDFLYADTETFSPTPIEHGTSKYAEKVEVMLFAYARNEDPVRCVDLTAGEKIPKEVMKSLTDPKVVKVFHNSFFDRTVIRESLGINIPVEQIWDTMVQTLAHGFPGALGELCDVLKIGEEKAKRKSGHRLIHLFCKPQPANCKLDRATRLTHPKEWAEFKEYAGYDIISMREIRKRIPRWNFNATERAIWFLDQKINDRGICLDRELIDGVLAAIKEEKKYLAGQTAAATDGTVQSATQRDEMLRYIADAHGIFLPDLRKDTLERRINDPELPEEIRELFALRLQSSKNSTAKFSRALRAVSSDGRLRGCLQYAGAARTLRWAGRNVQPQNFPRPTRKPQDVDRVVEHFKAGSARFIYEDTMTAAADCARGMLCASPGKMLAISDLANIEGRVAAWLAGEKWKLQAFRDFDSGKGEDLYKVAYGKAFQIPPAEVTKPQRSVGKVMELMLQYQGGVGAFLTGAATYRVDLNEMAEAALPAIPERFLHASKAYWEVASAEKKHFGLSRRVFVACDSLKRMWRDSHPRIERHWHELEEAWDMALCNPGEEIRVGKLIFIASRNYLRIRLPSGHHDIVYVQPKSAKKRSYMGRVGYAKQWRRIYTYGGKIFENICQSVARDVLAHGALLAETRDFEILLSVHDELITEFDPDTGLGVEQLNECLAAPPPWCKDLPLAAEGCVAQRYRKE